jgi:hypothetical protein
MGIGDWGLGIGDWGLGIGPNPQSPIPNPHEYLIYRIIKFDNLKVSILYLSLKKQKKWIVILLEKTIPIIYLK